MHNSRVEYSRFIAKVDELMVSWYGVSIYDLPDMNYRDYFVDGYTVEETVELAIDDMRIEFGFTGDPCTWA